LGGERVGGEGERVRGREGELLGVGFSNMSYS